MKQYTNITTAGVGYRVFVDDGKVHTYERHGTDGRLTVVSRRDASTLTISVDVGINTSQIESSTVKTGKIAALFRENGVDAAVLARELGGEWQEGEAEPTPS